MHLRASVLNVFTLSTLRMMFIAHSENNHNSDSWLWGGEAMENGRVRKETFVFALDPPSRLTSVCYLFYSSTCWKSTLAQVLSLVRYH